MSAFPPKTSCKVIGLFSNPIISPIFAIPISASIIIVFLPSIASAVPILTDDAVLPVPPFPDAIVYTLCPILSLSFYLSSFIRKLFSSSLNLFASHITSIAPSSNPSKLRPLSPFSELESMSSL